MKKCRWADEYKAVYPPRCGDGLPCEVCQEKWDEVCLEEALTRMKEAQNG